MKRKLFYRIPFVLVVFLMLSAVQVTAQVLNKPIPADNPNLAGNSPWTAACASSTFNEYYVNFTWGPPLVNGDNEFILELSDATGNFGSAVELARVSDKNTNFDFEFQMAIPTTTRGEGYRMRVRSTSPAMTSPVSDPYAMYYIDVDSGLTIRQSGQADFGDGTAQVCDGNSITLEVYDLPNAGTYSYNWYRSGTPLSEKSASITATQAGMYNAEIDYGSCSGSGNTLSNLIDVSTGTSLGIAINPPAKTALCSGETETLQANITGQGLTYIWFKDGTAITTPTVDDDSYTVDASVAGFEGDYQVEIFGTGACVERSAAITITNAGNFTVTRVNAGNLVVLPGLPQTLSVTTDASAPTYQWYRDGSPVSGATGSSLTVNDSETGTYFVRVSLSGGSCASTSIDSDTTVVVSPASFELIADYTSAYTACGNTSIVLQVATINAVASDASRTDVTGSLLNNFAYQWKKDGVNIGGATSSSISLTDTSENGSYEVDGVLSTYNATSNTLPVQLRVNVDITITSTSLVYCAGGDPVSIDSALDLNGETFQWERDGTVQSTTDTTLPVNATGTYRLVVSRGGCDIISNEVVIAPFDDSSVTIDSPNNIVFPEGTSRTVTASGGTAYQWFDENNTLLSSTDSYSFTEEGNFILIATVGSCEVVRQLTAEYQDTFKVPNVITVNGDGINDLWIIPNSYSNDPEVNIIIYNDQGEEILNQFDYQNNWPQSSTVFPKQNMVFFYKIRNAQEVLKQGTITIIR